MRISDWSSDVCSSDLWALGDCNGRGAFTHTAYNDFEIVAANLLGNEARSVADRIPAYAVFTDPPLARVGMTETEVRRSGRRALVGRSEEHTSELQSLMRISYAVFCLKKKIATMFSQFKHHA